MGTGASLALGFIKGANSARIERTEKERLEREALLEQRKGLITFVADNVKANMLNGQVGGTLIAGIEGGQINSLSEVMPFVADLNAEDTGQVFGDLKYDWDPIASSYGDTAEYNLQNFHQTWSSPQTYKQHLSYLTLQNPDEGVRMLDVLNGHIIQAKQNVFLGSPVSESTGQRVPVYTDLSQYEAAVKMRDELEKVLKTNAPSSDVVNLAYDRTIYENNVAPLGSNQAFVRTGNEGGAVTIGTEIGNIEGMSMDQKTGVELIDTLAAKFGFANRDVFLSNVAANGYYKNEPAKNVSLFLKNSTRLYNAGALDMVLEMGAGDETAQKVAQVLYKVSPDDDLATQVAALLPLMPDPKERSGMVDGLSGAPTTGAEYMEALGYGKGEEIRARFENAEEYVELIDELIALSTGDNANGTFVATGLAGLAQRVGVGGYAQGQQFSALFNTFDPVTDLKDGTTSDSLFTIAQKVFAEEAGVEVTAEYKIGKYDSLALYLAIKGARAADPAGRLSNQDFETQLRLLVGNGILDGQLSRKARLDTARERFAKLRDNTEFYYNMLDEIVDDRGKRMFDAYDVIKKARPFRPRDDAATVTPSTLLTGDAFQQQYPQAQVSDEFMPIEGKTVWYDPSSFTTWIQDNQSGQVRKPKRDELILQPPTSTPTSTDQTTSEPAVESPDTAAVETPAPTPPDTTLISGAQFAGKVRKSLGGGTFSFGDDPTRYKEVMKTVNGQEQLFYQKVM